MAIDLSTVVVKDVSQFTHTGLRELRNIPSKNTLLHSTVGRDSLAWLQRGSYLAGTPASCDKLFHKNGTIFVLVGWNEMSYHAGKSKWLGYSDERGTLNRSHQGWEFENMNDGRDPYTAEQYLSGAASYCYDGARGKWLDLWLPAGGHAAVALHPDGHLGRKSDPYAWDWGRFWGLVWSIRNSWPEEWPFPVWYGR